MNAPKLSSWHLGLLWFGAGVSLAEIMAGTLFVPLGFGWGLLAIIGGHLLGAGIFFLLGWIAWKENKDAMATCDASLGPAGVRFFAAVNVLQLIGWTAVMIIVGAQGLNAVLGLVHIQGGEWLSKLVIGALLLLWACFNLKGLKTVTLVSVILLAIFCFYWGIKLVGTAENQKLIFSHPGSLKDFGSFFELALVMPLSWLPLVGDYTKKAKKGLSGSLGAAIGYGIASVFMYVLGLVSTLVQPYNDVVASMIQAGLGLGAGLVVILSTVTTGYLDIHSAGVSARLTFPKIKENKETLLSVLAGLLGLVLALFVPSGWYENFLYFIASVFAPLFAVVLTHFFITRKAQNSQGVPNRMLLQIFGLIAVGLGILAYYLLLSKGTFFGVSMPSMIISAIIYVLLFKGVEKWKKA